jgi:DNA-binding YbaB/EbfC family protein
MSTDDTPTPIQPDGIVQAGGLADGPEDEHVGGAETDPLAALLGGGSGGSGGLDFGALMEQASSMQAQLLAAQEHVAETVVEGVAGGGAVKISVTGGWEFQSVAISPDAVDPSDIDMLQDLVLAALSDAASRIGELQQQSMDLGGLGGLLGGS